MRLVFADFTLDPGRRELRQQGEDVALEPQTFDLLHYLIDHRDRVVGKDELIEAIWQGRFIAEATLSGRINAARRAIGDSGQAQWAIRTIARRGFRFVADVQEEGRGPVTAGDDAAPAPSPAEDSAIQSVRFCRAPDGVRLAYAVSGQGPVLVKAANWVTHIQQDWDSPIWSHLLRHLSSERTLVRYDARGNGLSDRQVDNVSFDAWVGDLAAVADGAAGERFSLFGMSQGAAVAAAYAARYPERVDRLILVGGYAKGAARRGPAQPPGAAGQNPLAVLLQQSWGDESAAYLRALSALYMPDASPEQAVWFARLQRQATEPAMAARIRQVADQIDVTAELPSVRAPTLVIHGRGDAVAPLEAGRLFAQLIPNAEFMVLDSANHLPAAGDPAWQRAEAAIDRFLAEP